MKCHITQYSICIPLTNKQWEALMRIDNLRHKTNGEYDYDIFIATLRTAGANDVEFNGHFGMNIFFNVEDKDAAEKVRKYLQTRLR